MPRRDEIVTQARTWIGTPWRHQGTMKGGGCDCLGLIKGVARDFNMPQGQADTEKYRGYGRLPNPVTMLEGLAKHLHRIPPEEAGAGDILLFMIEGEPQHLAILTEEGNIIHAFTHSRKIIEQRIPNNWRRQIMRAYRYPGVT